MFYGKTVSEFVLERCGLSDAVRLGDVADFHHAADTDGADHCPAVQRGCALYGQTYAVQHSGIFFLAAGDQRALFAGKLFFSLRQR